MNETRILTRRDVQAEDLPATVAVEEGELLARAGIALGDLLGAKDPGLDRLDLERRQLRFALTLLRQALCNENDTGIAVEDFRLGRSEK